MNITDIKTTKHFAETFKLEEEVDEPSSYWNENMQMIADEVLPPEMRLYCAWNTYRDRKLENWLFFAPNHIFKLPHEKSFLIAQNKQKWLLYMSESSELHLTCPGNPTIVYSSIVDINGDIK
jgi:hypothetical protein